MTFYGPGFSVDPYRFDDFASVYPLTREFHTHYYSGGSVVTGQLADTPTRGLPTRGLDESRTGHLADWSTR